MADQGPQKRPLCEDEQTITKRPKVENTHLAASEGIDLLTACTASQNLADSSDFGGFEMLSFETEEIGGEVSEPMQTDQQSLEQFPADISEIMNMNVCADEEFFDMPSFEDDQASIAFKSLEEALGLSQVSEPSCFSQLEDLTLTNEEESKLSPKLSDILGFESTTETVGSKDITDQRQIDFEEMLLTTQLKNITKKKENFSEENSQEIPMRCYPPRRAERKYTKTPRVKTNSGSCDNSDFEFTSDSEKSSGIGQKEESNDESHSSLSPISFDNSDDNLEGEHLNELVNKCSRESLAPSFQDSSKLVNVEDSLADLVDLDSDGDTSASAQTSLSLSHSLSAKPSTEIIRHRLLSQAVSSRKCGPPQKTQQPNPLIAQEPLWFIAEAMQSTDMGFPKFQSKDLPDNMDSSINCGSHDDRKRIMAQRSLRFDNTNGSVGRGSPQGNYEETMMSYLTKLSREPPEKLDKSNTNAICSPHSAKDSDSDDSVWRRKPQTMKSDTNNGKDFYEDDSSFEEDKLVSDDEEDAANADMPCATVLNDYEQLFHEIRKIVDQVPNRFKYEIYSLLYPTMAVVYLRMISCGKCRRGKTFVESALRYIDHSYMARVDKLMVLQTSADMPHRAKKLIADDNEQVSVCMNEETYYVLLLYMENWSRSIQMTFIRHFDLFPDDNNGEPRQLTRIGSAILDKIYWATSEITKETKELSPRPLRRKRFKKDKHSPTRNVLLPAGNRLYTPTPKRWDMERHKDDEERRVPLDRDNLPSAYLYTALENVETIISASFSNKTTMLSVGTAASAIHIFSLTSSKLVQLKSAKCLKRLDTGMSGIDESMLDATKRKMRRTLYGHQGPVYACAFAPHDRFLLSCSQDRTIRCWCLLSWSCVVIYPGHCAAIYSVVYAPLGYYFATASDDRTARVWTQDSKKSVCILVGHLSEVVCVQFHPNRHYLATGSADCTVRLWDIVKAVQVRVFSGHRNSINTLAFSACGRYLVSGSDDSFVVLWDVEREEMVRCLAHHTGAINCIEVALDNKLIIVGGQDCQMSIWDFERLVHEHNPEKVKPGGNDADPKRSELKSQDFLIKSYASRGTPFYKLRITRRNLLLGFCVKPANHASKDSKQKAESAAKYAEWLEFLDILKLKACFAQENYRGSSRLAIEAPMSTSESESSDESDQDFREKRYLVFSDDEDEGEEPSAKQCSRFGDSDGNEFNDADNESSGEETENPSKSFSPRVSNQLASSSVETVNLEDLHIGESKKEKDNPRCDTDDKQIAASTASLQYEKMSNTFERGSFEPLDRKKVSPNNKIDSRLLENELTNRTEIAKMLHNGEERAGDKPDEGDSSLESVKDMSRFEENNDGNIKQKSTKFEDKRIGSLNMPNLSSNANGNSVMGGSKPSDTFNAKIEYEKGRKEQYDDQSLHTAGDVKLDLKPTMDDGQPRDIYQPVTADNLSVELMSSSSDFPSSDDSCSFNNDASLLQSFSVNKDEYEYDVENKNYDS